MKPKKDDSKMYSSAKHNEVKQARESKMMSKAELARKAGVTVQTIDRIERGYECRLATKRKIILALGYQLAERTKVFRDSDDPQSENQSSESQGGNTLEGNTSEFSKQDDRMRILRKDEPFKP
jgi:DNA-binding XRE family transcriptional regulator